MDTSIHVYIYIYNIIHILIYTDIYIYIYIYIYICRYVYMYIYICIYRCNCICLHAACLHIPCVICIRGRGVRTNSVPRSPFHVRSRGVAINILDICRREMVIGRREYTPPCEKKNSYKKTSISNLIFLFS